METPDTMTVEQAAETLLVTETPEAEVEDAEVIEETAAEDVDEDAPEDAEGDEADIEDETDPEDDDEDEEPEEDEAPADFHTVTVDGETKRVSLDELKRGYSGQTFVQKGMQANAEARKMLLDEARNLQQSRDEFLYLRQQAQEGGLTPPTPPSDDMIQSDPIGYMEAQARYQAEMTKYGQNMEALERQREYDLAQRQAQYQQHISAQAEQVKQEIPELADPEKGGKVLADLKQKGLDYGFTDEELSGLYDSRMVKVLNDARKWRNLQSSKSAAAKKAEGARPVMKPGAKARPESKKKQREKQREKLRQSGRIEDAISLLFE